MTKTTKTVLTVLAIYFAVIGGVVFTIGAVVWHAGFVSLHISEKDRGTRIHMPLPALLLNPVIRIASAGGRWATCDDEVEDLRPAIRAAMKESVRYRDFTLLEVEDHGERVTIRKRNGALEIRVNAPDADVHITLPESTMELVADSI